MTLASTPATLNERIAESQARLDQASVLILRWGNARFYDLLKTRGIETMGQLREAWPALLKEHPPGLSAAVCRLANMRFSREIFCPNCGAPHILFARTKLCEEHGPGCERSVLITPGSLLHKAFPDRIGE